MPGRQTYEDLHGGFGLSRIGQAFAKVKDNTDKQNQKRQKDRNNYVSDSRLKDFKEHVNKRLLQTLGSGYKDEDEVRRQCMLEADKCHAKGLYGSIMLMDDDIEDVVNRFMRNDGDTARSTHKVTTRGKDVDPNQLYENSVNRVANTLSNLHSW